MSFEFSSLTLREAGPFNAGDRITLDWTVVHLGDSTADLVVPLVLSANARISGGDPVIDTLFLDDVPRVSVLPGSTQITLPEPGHPGYDGGIEFTLGVLDTTPNQGEDDDEATVLINDGAGNLRPTGLTRSTDVGFAGEEITVGFEVTNAGTSAVTASEVAIVLSQDAFIDGADPELIRAAVPSLAAGASHAGTLTFALPPAGDPVYGGDTTFTLGLEVDPDDAIRESSETDNAALPPGIPRALTVLPGPPDLALTGLSVDDDGTGPEANLRPGDRIGVTLDLDNTGGLSETGPFDVVFTLGDDDTDTATHAVFRTETAFTVPEEAANRQTFYFRLPDEEFPLWDQTTGVTLQAIIDPAGDLRETDTSDNRAETGLTVQQGDADLEVFFSYDWRTESRAGDQVEAEVFVDNSGNDLAPPTIVAFFLSDDLDRDPSIPPSSTDALIGFVEVPELEDGGFFETTLLLDLPVGTDPIYRDAVDFVIRAYADISDTAIETDEDNNTEQQEIRVESGQADLSLRAFAFHPDPGPSPTFKAGSDINFSAVVENIGFGASDWGDFDILLDGETILSTEFDDRGPINPVPPLAAGESVVLTGSLRLPGPGFTGYDAPDDVYDIVAVVDSDDDTFERVEGNNTRSQPLVFVQSGRGDATTTRFHAPDKAARGETIALEFAFQSVGTVPAGPVDWIVYLSADDTIDAGDHPLALGSVRLGTAPFPFFLDVALPAPDDAVWQGGRDYTIGVLVDPDGESVESDRTNNGNQGEGIDLATIEIDFNLGDGAERATGDERAEAISGQAGDDTLLGMGGDDTLAGGLGDDSLSGGAGDDLIRGNAGEDILEGGAGEDQLRGQKNGDLLDGGDGHDNLKGGGGNDTLVGGEGRDFLNGGARRDLLDAGVGNDRLVGRSFDDTLIGGQGKDFLNAGGENDRLTGGTENDRLKGGDGADVFVFDLGMDIDRIVDFAPDEDRLEITEALAAGRAAADIAALARQEGGALEIDFGGGDVLRLLGLTDAAGLAGQIDIV